MNKDPHASLHLGLSAEAMLLIDPQLEHRSIPPQRNRGWLVPASLYFGLLSLLSGIAMVPDQRFFLII